MTKQAGVDMARLWPKRMLSFCASALHSVVLPAAQPPTLLLGVGMHPRQRIASMLL